MRDRKILRMLSENRVIDVELSDDKQVVEITEGCDSYFSVTLSYSAVVLLINELRELADEMR